MKTYSHLYKHAKDLTNFIQSLELDSSKEIFVQIFTCEKKHKKISQLVASIADNITNTNTNAHIIAIKTSQLIYNGQFVNNATLVSFTLFEKASVKVFSVSGDDGKKVGQNLAKLVTDKNPKLMLIYSCGDELNNSDAINQVAKVIPDTLITGADISVGNSEENAYIINNEKVLESGVVAACFYGEELKAWLEFNCSWQPLGDCFTVTEADGNKLISVDGVPVKDYYREYFGKMLNHEMADKLFEFPVRVINKSAKYVARIKKVHADSIEFTSNFEKGDILRFSIQSRKTFARVLQAMVEKYSNKNIETCFLFYNSERKNILKKYAEREIEIYCNLSKTCLGLLSNLEYFHRQSDRNGHVFSLSCSQLYLTENEKSDEMDEIDRTDRTDRSFQNSENDPVDLIMLLPNETMDQNEIRNYFIETILDNDELKNNYDMMLENERLHSLGQLVGGVAHSLSTPIMGAAGQMMIVEKKLKKLSEALMKEKIKSDEVLGILKDLTEHRKYVSDYLFYMSDVVQAVKKQVRHSDDDDENAKFSIGELLKQLQILISFELKKSNVKLNLNVFEELYERSIPGDISCILQVIINLIQNSIDAYSGREGQVNLGVSIEYKYPGTKVFCKITVEDFAGGIPENIRKQLFYKMITTKGNKGTGMGVYFSNVMIKAKFGGEMEYKIDEGVGTTFYIYIPVK